MRCPAASDGAPPGRAISLVSWHLHAREEALRIAILETPDHGLTVPYAPVYVNSKDPIELRLASA